MATEVAPMFVDPFYYQIDRNGLCEGYVDANGNVYLAYGGGYHRDEAIVRATFGGYYARVIIEGLVFHVEGDTPGHAAAALMVEVASAANELARRAAEIDTAWQEARLSSNIR
jgi:hypothetical protein